MNNEGSGVLKMRLAHCSPEKHFRANSPVTPWLNGFITQRFNVNNLFAQIKQTASQRLSHFVIIQKIDTGYMGQCFVDINSPHCSF